MLLTLAVDESRCATFTVTNRNDSGSGSLRAAIDAANAAGGADAIHFQIGGSGVRSIVLVTPLPIITGTVTVDGTTQSGYAGTPRIEIACADQPYGLRVSGAAAAGSELRALAINDFSVQGIAIEAAPSVRVRGCFVGTDALGSMALRGPGTPIGVQIVAANGAWIGGLASDDRCVISGNVTGVLASGSAGLLVQNAHVGVNAAGTAAIANTGDGLVLSDCVGARIGHETVAGRVLVSGNGGHGIRLTGVAPVATRNHLILGCYVGVDVTGNADLGNVLDGVRIEEQGNQVGGLPGTEGNVISGNGGAGVRASAPRAISNGIWGNHIGVNAAGTAAIPNANGVVIDAPNNLVGGAGIGNVISGNTGDGVVLNSTGARVAGNFIGTNAAGSSGLANTGNGVYVTGRGSRIGGNHPGERNLISGNVACGVQIAGAGAFGNVIDRAIVGLDSTGTAPIANGADGVRIVDAPQNVVGSTGAGMGNVISGNVGTGVSILGLTAVQNQVLGNHVGALRDGAGTIANGGAGVRIDAAANVVGTDFGGGNAIGGNLGAGVEIAGGSGNAIVSNAIWASGGLGIDLAPPGPNGVDSLDLDTGANEQQNAPRLLFALPSGPLTVVGGELRAQPFTNYRIQIFGATECGDAGEPGQGRYWLGEVQSTTNIGGSAGIYWTYDGTPPAPAFVATAIDPFGNTSEFSACIALGESHSTGADAPSARSRLFAPANPVRGEPAIRFVLARAGKATLEVLDVRGRCVARLAEGEHAAGEHRVSWRGASRGVYWLHLVVDGESPSSARLVKLD